MLTLEGHQGAVWAVALMPQQGLILTGMLCREETDGWMDGWLIEFIPLL